MASEFLRKMAGEEEDEIAPVSPQKVTIGGREVDTSGLSNNRVVRAKKEQESGATWLNEKNKLWEDGWQFGDITKTILGTVSDIGEDIGAGIIGMGETLVDASSMLAPHLIRGQLYNSGFGLMADTVLSPVFDQMKQGSAEFAKKDLYDEATISKQLTENTTVPGLILKNAGLNHEDISVIGQKGDSLVQSAGQIGVQIGLDSIAPGTGMILMGSNAFGAEAENALKSGATLEEATLSGAISAGAEVLTEQIFGGIKFGGKTVDEGLARTISANISDQFVRRLAKFGLDVFGEGAEEWITEDISRFGQWLTYRNDENLLEMLFSPEALQEKIDAFIGGAILGGGGNVVQSAVSKANGKDSVTGLTKDENAVVEKLYNDALTEKQKDGKLSARDKTKLYNEILRQMDDGEISIDKIEEILGGDDYKAYQDILARDKAAIEELKGLYEGDELKQKIADIAANSERAKAKETMRTNVAKMVKGERLSQSYAEAAKSRQKFAPDLEKVDPKYRSTFQRAAESGVLNDTRKAYQFVENIAALEADTGVQFDIYDDAMMKEAGFSVKGKRVHGAYLRGDNRVVINIKSPKAWQTTVGHEITHAFEKAGKYDAFAEAMVKYGKTLKGDGKYKNEYERRLAEAIDNYGNVDGYKGSKGLEEIKKEVVADMVGDYLFQDSDFVQHLHNTDRTLFQRLFDEIKRIYKLVIPGSKEEQELAKVKKAFEDVYNQAKESKNTKENKNTADGGVKYSVSETTDGRFVAVVDNDILSHIDTSKWDKKAKSEAKKAANEALKAFSDGFNINGVEYVGNKKSRDEYTRSDYTEALARKNPEAFLDKMRVASVLDDVVRVATDWANDGYLKYDRPDYVDFIRGKTLIKSGDRTYSAVVLAGIKENGEAVFHDVEDIYPDTFEIKESEPSTAVATNKSPNAILESSDGDNVAQKAKNVKYSLSDSDGKQLTSEQQEYFKDSKIRDENGNLLVVKHGTNDDFHIFDFSKAGRNGHKEGFGFYFSDDSDITEGYGDIQKEVYLNITKPLYNNKRTVTKEELARLTNAVIDHKLEKYKDDGGDWRDSFISNYLYTYEKGMTRQKAVSEFVDQIWDTNTNDQDLVFEIAMGDGDMYVPSAMREFYDVLTSTIGYDGIIAEWTHADGTSNVYVTFSPEQSKYTTNEKPTSNVDMRYSLDDTAIQAIQSIGRTSINQFTVADLQKTEGLARQYWQEMGIKSPLFRVWFGDWRANDQTRVQVATQKGGDRGTQKNEDTGWEIQVSGKVFNETRAHNDSYNVEARKYLPYIDDIVKNAILLDSFGIDAGKPKSNNSLLMHSLYAVADIGSGPEVLKLYIEEMNDPNRESTSKRAYQLQNIEKYQPTGKSSQKTASSISPVATGNIRTIADLFAYVKQKDTNFQPKPASKIVNPDGTPMVMYHGSPAQFTIFDKKKAKYSGLYGRGFYFTNSDSHAATYGNRYSVYLNIRNPLQDGRDTVTRTQVRAYLEAVAENEDYSIENYGTYDVDAVLNNVMGQAGTIDAYQLISDVNATAIGDLVEATELFNQVNGTEFDGIVVPTETVAFYPNQIKSATDNIGTFNPDNPDIRYSLSPEGDTGRQYGNFYTPANELSLDIGPVREDVNPSVENVEEEQPIAPATESLLPDDIAPSENVVRDTSIGEKNTEIPYAPAVNSRESVGAAPSGFDPISHLEYEYGNLPEGENPVRDDTMPKSVTGDDKVSLTARTVKGAEATPDEFVDLLDKEVVGGRLSYMPITNSETTKRAYDNIVKKGWESARGEWSRRVRNGEVSAELSATGALLLNNAAKAGDSKVWLDVLHDYRLMGTNAGQAVQAMRILKTLTPADDLYMIERSIEQMVEDMKLPTEIVIGEKWKTTYIQAETEAEREVARKELAKDIARQIPATAMDKWTALRYLNMLGNLRTQIRNIIGNFGMSVTSGVKNTIATGIERLAHKASGGKFHRTKSLFVSRELLESAKNDFANVESMVLNGGKFNDSMAMSHQFQQDVQDARKIFKTPPLEWYRKVTNIAMNKGDLLFSKPAYARALAGYLKANGIKETDFSKIDQNILDEARAYAIKEAQEQTFRDNNWLSSWLSRIGRRQDTPKIGKLISEGVMPFRKTPANILLRAEEYSPLGIINATVKSIQTAKGTGEVTGADVVNSWSKAFTGTGLFVLGMLLNNSGALSGGPDEDEDKDWFEDLYGWQNYAIKIGDYNFTIDFLSPSAMPLLMGAQLNELRQEGGIELKDLESALLSIADPMIEMSMLQGVNDTLDNIRYAESNMGQFLINACVSYLTQGLTNSFLGQIERSFEGQRMTTYVDKDSGVPDWLQKALGKASAKTPGWDYQQMPYVDAWGETEDIAPLPALGENALSPSYISQGVSDELYEELNRLNDVQSDINVYPQTPDKTLSFTDANGNKHTDYHLSADEYVALAKMQGQTQKKLVEDILSSDIYSELTDQEKAKAISLAYKYAKEYSRIEVLNSEGFESKWMGEAEDIADAIIAHSSEERTFAYDSPGKYAVAKSVGGYNSYKTYTKELYDIKADKDKDGNSIQDSRKKKVISYINSLDVDYGTKLILYKSEYNSAPYDREIISYLNSRDDLSREDKLAIAEELGIKVK